MTTSAQSFSTVTDEHVDSVFGFFGYRERSRAEAERLTQITFELARDGWGEFEHGGGNPATWLLTIARDQPVARQEPGTGESDVVSSDRELIAALNRLDRGEREVIALSFGAGLGGRDIATMTGLSVEQIRQITTGALRRLRYELHASA